MTSRRTVPALASMMLVGLVGVTLHAAGVFGAFTANNSSSANSFSTASDYRAPTAGRSVIAKTQGGTPGYIRAGGTYYVYADVTDTGNPASGVSTVTSNTSTLTGLGTSTPLSSGSFSIGGLSYGYRTASLTATSSLVEGTYAYTLTSTDAAANSGTQSFSVVVDNTAPTAGDVQTANGNGGTPGRAEAGDTITLTYSEPIDPNSIISGWNGSASSVVVRLINGILLLGDDALRVYDSTNTNQLPLGTVDMGRGDYVGGLLGGETALFGATGSPSTMTASGNSVTITLGTASGQGATTAGGNGTMSWTPSGTATDRAGNGALTTPASESGSADKDF